MLGVKRTQKFLRSKRLLRVALYNEMIEEIQGSLEGILDALSEEDFDLMREEEDIEEFGGEYP